MHWRHSIAYIPHHSTSVWFLCIIYPLFTVRIPNWHSASLARILIISRFSPYPHWTKWVPHFWGGDVIHLVTLTNADAMATQFLSPYFSHDSWSTFHHPSNNSQWDTHIYTTEKPPPSQYEVQMDWEAAWISDVTSPWWGKDRLTEPKCRNQVTGRVWGEISHPWSVRRSLYHSKRADLEPAPELPDLPDDPGWWESKHGPRNPLTRNPTRVPYTEKKGTPRTIF